MISELKKDIETINNSIDLINNLQPKKYKRLDNQDIINEYGLIAQDVEKVIPDIVFNEPNYIPNI